MYSAGNDASGREFQSLASSTCTWNGAPIAAESTHRATRRSVIHSTLETPGIDSTGAAARATDGAACGARGAAAGAASGVVVGATVVVCSTVVRAGASVVVATASVVVATGSRV